MKAANKSIFDKSYIIEAQAIKAAVKEFGEGWADGHKISFDEATKKFRVQSLKTPAQAVADLEHATHEVVAQMTAKPKNGNGRRATDVLENLSLAEALKESGETIEDLKAGDELANSTMTPEFVMPENCPHCGIGLDNGICVHGDEVNRSMIKLEKHTIACLGCGGEFGPLIADVMAKPRLSTCERPTKRVWDIADSMPKASRKEVMAECVRQGIAYGTSRTQYQAWFKASQTGSKVDVRKPYQKGE